MLRLLPAFLWLRWRIAANFLRAGRRRDAFTHLARLIEVLVQFAGIVLIGLLVVVATVLALVGGFEAARSSLDPNRARDLLRGGLAFVTLLAAFTELAVGSKEAMPQLARFLLLPVEHRELHRIGLLTRLTDPLTLLAVGPLVGLPIGFLLAGRVSLALVGGIAGGAMIAAFLSLQSLLRSAGRLLQKRPRTAGLILAALILPLPVLASLFSTSALRAAQSWEALWTLNVPAEVFVTALEAAYERRTGDALTATAGLLLLAGWMLPWAERVHGRVVNRAMSGGPLRRAKARRRSASPFDRDLRPVSVLAWTQLRHFLRGGGLVVIAAAGFVSIICAVCAVAYVDLGAHRMAFPVVTEVSLVLTLLFILPKWVNLFALDGAGLTLQLLQPIDGKTLLRSKAIGCGLVTLPCFGLPYLVAVAFLRPPWADAVSIGAFVILSGVSFGLLFIPVGIMVSAVFPRKMQAQGKNDLVHPVAVLVGNLAFMPVWGIPAAVGLVGLYFEKPALAVASLVLWCLAALAVHGLLMKAALEIWRRRQESVWLAVTTG